MSERDDARRGAADCHRRLRVWDTAADADAAAAEAAGLQTVSVVDALDDDEAAAVAAETGRCRARLQ